MLKHETLARLGYEDKAQNALMESEEHSIRSSKSANSQAALMDT